MALGKNMRLDKLIPTPDPKLIPQIEANQLPENGFDLDLSLPITENDSEYIQSSRNEKEPLETPVFDMDLSLIDEPTIPQDKVATNDDLIINLNEQSVSFDFTLDEASSSEVVVEQQVLSEPTKSIPFEDVITDSIKVVFTPSRRKTQKRILVAIEGDITINNIELLYNNVTPVFDLYDFVEISLTNVTGVDLTAIQLFHAMRVCYYPLNKFVSINAEFSRDERKLLNLCGFTEFQTQVTANV